MAVLAHLPIHPRRFPGNRSVFGAEVFRDLYVSGWSEAGAAFFFKMER